MTLQKAIYGLCLMLILAVQFAVAQHAMIHPIDIELGGHTTQDHHHDHKADHDEDGSECQLCDAINAFSYGLNGLLAVMASGLLVFLLTQGKLVRRGISYPYKSSPYFSQAPPFISYQTI